MIKQFFIRSFSHNGRRYEIFQAGESADGRTLQVECGGQLIQQYLIPFPLADEWSQNEGAWARFLDWVEEQIRAGDEPPLFY